MGALHVSGVEKEDCSNISGEENAKNTEKTSIEVQDTHNVQVNQVRANKFLQHIHDPFLIFKLLTIFPSDYQIHMMHACSAKWE